MNENYENARATLCGLLRMIGKKLLSSILVLPWLAVVFCCLLVAPAAHAQQRQPVRGKVVDAQSQPLVGVSVAVKNTSTGTATDVDGNFVVNAAPTDSLLFSYVGFKAQQLLVGNQNNLLINLGISAKNLEEVVVVGYTSRPQSELVSSVSVVSGKDLRDVTGVNTGNLLQGKAAGVVVSNASGQPGTAPSIRIRGTGSISAGAEPLYVVDGVIGGTSNPADIESITVLKDAAATGLYGSRAANGVVVITTKRGKSGKTQVAYNGTTGVSRRVEGNFKVMDGQQLFDFSNQLYQNDYTGKRNAYLTALRRTNPSPTAAQIDAYLTSNNFPLTYQDYAASVLPAQPGNTNWLDETFRTAAVNNHQLSVSGGSDKTRFYLSGTYFKEQGTVIKTGYQQTNFRINLEHSISDRLKISTRVNAQFSNRTNDASGAIYQSFLNMPWDNPYRPDGSVRLVDSDTDDWYGRDKSNFLYTNLYNYDRSRGQRLDSDLRLEYRITDWLSFATTNRYSTENTRSESNNDSRTPDGGAINGELDNSYGYSNTFLTSNLLTTTNQFGRHSLRGIVGAEYQNNALDGISASGRGIFPGLGVLAAAATPYLIGGTKTRNNFLSGFVNADYNYDSRYFLTASFRSDGSSRFGADKRFGNFYSVGGAWDLSNENFFKELATAVNLLKVRSSYGVTGNANISDFGALDLYEFSVQYANQPGGFPRRLQNASLTWEKAHTFDVGIEIGFLNRVNLTVDLYNRTNKDILQDVPLSSGTGFYSQTQNIGAVRNRGLEIELNTKNLQGAFSWNTDFNISFNRNKVLELYGNQPIDRSSQRIEVGRPIGSWYMRDWQGVDPSNGNPLWLLQQFDQAGNYTGNTTTSNYNQASRVYVGTTVPKLSGGFRNTFSYKSVTLNAFLNFVSGNKVYNADRELFDSDGAYPTYNTMALQDGWSRWEKEGDISTHPRAVLNGNKASNKPSSRYLEDGSYLRLRNVTLSYDLPTATANKLRAQGLRIFLSGDNLLTWTKFSGIDPEVDLSLGSSAGRYPTSRKLLLGVNLNF